MATITASASGGNWSSTAAWVGGVVPTIADDVVLGSSSGNITIDGTQNCASLTCTNYTGTLTHASGNILNIAGSLTFGSGMTYATATGTMNFNGSGTGNTITTAGKNFATSFIINGTGSWQLQDNLNGAASSALLTLTKGTLDTNSKTIGNYQFVSSNTNTRSLILRTTTWTISGTGRSWDIGTSTGMTLSAASSTIICGATTTMTFNGGSLTYGTITHNQTGVLTLSGANTIGTLNISSTAQHSITGSNTITNLNVTPGATKTAGVTFSVNQTITNLTITGNSAVNRARILSATPGTPITLSAATVSINNADFADITAAGAANWDLSAGIVGHCGGNTGITFTAATTCYWVGNGGSMSTTSKWASASNGSGGTVRVPLPQDTARFDANSITSASQTITVDIPHLPAMNFTGVLNSPTLDRGATAVRVCGDITLVSGMTNTGAGALNFYSKAGTVNVTSAGVSWPCAIVLQLSGTVNLVDAFTTTASITHTQGTLTANANINSPSYSSSNTNTRALNMGSGTWTISGTGTVWDITTATNMTLTRGTSTVSISDTSASTKTFSGGSLTYYNLSIAGAASNGAVSVTGSNTFNAVALNPDTSVKFQNGGTQTIQTPPRWLGTSGHLITIDSTSTGTATLSVASGIVGCDYLNLSRSAATGGATFYAGSHSTNTTGNSGWSFTSAQFNLAADLGAYGLTGIDAGLKTQRALKADLGAYSIAGVDVNLAKTFRLIAGQGSYSITGVAAIIRPEKILFAGAGIYSVDGKDQFLKAAKVLQAAKGVYAISGNTVGIYKPLNKRVVISGYVLSD